MFEFVFLLCSQTTAKTADIGCTISWRHWSIRRSYPSKREFVRPSSNGGYSPSYWWTDWRKKTPRTNENSGTLSCLTFTQIAFWGGGERCCVDFVKKFTSRLCLKPVVKTNTVVTVLDAPKNISDRFRIHLHVVFKIKKNILKLFFFEIWLFLAENMGMIRKN